jgi:hypothetical protein
LVILQSRRADSVRTRKRGRGAGRGRSRQATSCLGWRAPRGLAGPAAPPRLERSRRGRPWRLHRRRDGELCSVEAASGDGRTSNRARLGSINGPKLSRHYRPI